MVMLLAKAVLTACDASDRVTDGIVGNPESCGFKPASLQCTTSSSENCLTAAQVATVNDAYGAVKTNRASAEFQPSVGNRRASSSISPSERGCPH